MIAGDAELLALARAGQETRPPAAVWAVIAAMREGHRTVGSLMECTGYDRATIYRSREWLDDRSPGWRGEEPQDAPGVELVPVAPEPAPVEVIDLEPPPRTIRPPKTHGPPSLLWRDCLARHRDAVSGSRTWDLYVDIYSPAADELFAAGKMGDLIALTIDYVKVVIGGEITGAERKRIAQVVRIHGKAVLYGMQEALARVDEPTVGPAVTYAVSVARSAHRAIRTKQNGATP